MLIQPDTYIRLIKNCPLDKTYDHTIYFEDEQSQIQYFKYTLQGIPFSKQSYQRYDRGVLHIQEKAENLYDCNYLMFQNSAFGNKYFYAFVTSIEYVNNISSRVTYEIDVMQTWYFNYNLGHCFVEREHSVTDNIGENLIEEKLETGTHYITQLDVMQCPFNAGEYDVIIAQGTNKLRVESGETGEYWYDCVVSNVFSGIDFTRYRNPSEAYQALKDINNAGKSDSVVAVFMVPSIFWGEGSQVSFNDIDLVMGISRGLENPYSDSFDGYIPHNNKLYTSPYFGLICKSSSGDTHEYAYEYFADPNNPAFDMSFSIGASPEAVLNPARYKGVTSENLNEGLTCKDFPQCAYATDTFRAYLAQNAGRLSAEAFNAVGNWQLSRRTTFPVISDNANNSLVSSVANILGTLRDVSVLPPQVRGSGASYINYTKNKVGFIFYKYKIRREFAEIIDSYFDMFGYATHKVKIPNTNSRPHWNYVKTMGCVITGSIPADDTAKICSIYDRGITFWKNGAEVGDYSLDNKPV